MADKDRTPSETAMEAAKRIEDAIVEWLNNDTPMLEHKEIARIIDEAYAPIINAALNAAASGTAEDQDAYIALIRRATPREAGDGK